MRDALEDGKDFITEFADIDKLNCYFFFCLLMNTKHDLSKTSFAK